MRRLNLPQQTGVAQEVWNQTVDPLQVARQTAERAQHSGVVLLVPVGAGSRHEHLENHAGNIDVSDGEVPNWEDLQLPAAGR